MATHSSVLAWRIPGTVPGESQGGQSLVGCCLWGPTELDKVFSGTYFKSLSPPEKRRGRACRCSPGFTEISPEGAQGFCCRCLPEVPASPLPCSGELGDASEGIVTRRGTELRAPFRTVRGPRRSQLLRVGCEDQDRGCWRMRKGSPKLCKQSQFQVHSLGWHRAGGPSR